MTKRCEWIKPHPCATFLPPSPVPEWIENLSKQDTLPTPIPIVDVLNNSCFYPASGLDASPVRIVNGYVHSFIYVDYSVSRESFLENINNTGFYGYEIILQRDITKDEIVPPYWRPQMPQYFDNPGFDGYRRLQESQQRCKPFGHWSIWRRKQNYGNKVGPNLFGFFFLGGEALACYQGLYMRHAIVPRVLAIIQPGHILGDNWTNFQDSRAPLWKEVSSMNKLPEIVLIGYANKWFPKEKECPFEGYIFITREFLYNAMRFACIYCDRTANNYPLCMTLCGLDHTVDVFRLAKTE